MLILGQDVLRRASRRNAPLKKWLETWAATVESRIWRSLNDVRRDYPSADGVKLRSDLVVTVFNVKGNEFRMLTSVDFDLAAVEVLEILTHAEYDKDAWKQRY
jgi:mRNA interferase HigB